MSWERALLDAERRLNSLLYAWAPESWDRAKMERNLRTIWQTEWPELSMKYNILVEWLPVRFARPAVVKLVERNAVDLLGELVS